MKLITKFGTNAIFDSEKKEIKKQILEQIAKDASKFLKQSNELIIVSSGAVGLGKKILNEGDGIALKQAQAAIGQPMLMQEYQNAFNKYKLNIAQFLLTYEDLDSKIRTENINHTYQHLKKNKIIPIINENDTTAIEELSLGDNDNLTTELAIALNFDTIINYTEKGTLLKNKNKIILASIYDSEFYDKIKTNGTGFGGLASKLQAAKKANENNINYFIAKAGENIFKILNGKVEATKFI